MVRESEHSSKKHLKTLDWVYLGLTGVLFIISSFPVWGWFANSSQMWGPMPMSVTWSYLWFAVDMVLIWVVSATSFRTWAKRVDRWVRGNVPLRRGK